MESGPEIRLSEPGPGPLRRWRLQVPGVRARPVREFVGQHSFDGDPQLTEVGVGTSPEPCRGLLAFIGEDLGVGQPREVIDGVMQKGIPAALLAVVAVADRAPEFGVTTAVGDSALAARPIGRLTLQPFFQIVDLDNSQMVHTPRWDSQISAAAAVGRM